MTGISMDFLLERVTLVRYPKVHYDRYIGIIFNRIFKSCCITDQRLFDSADFIVSVSMRGNIAYTPSGGAFKKQV